MIITMIITSVSCIPVLPAPHLSASRTLPLVAGRNKQSPFPSFQFKKTKLLASLNGVGVIATIYGGSLGADCASPSTVAVDTTERNELD